MAEFVRAQIFGTTFEITSRYDTGGVPFGAPESKHLLTKHQVY